MATAAAIAMHAALSTMSSTSVSSSAASRGTSQNLGQQMAYKMRNLATQNRPTIEIILDGAHGPHGAYVTSYSTMDKLQGTVNITATHDIKFDDVEISFIGISKTYVDRLSTAPSISGGRTEATHRFLRLIQPIDESTLPVPRVFSAGRTYSFPFTFVVPQHLLPRACGHNVANSAVRDAHLLLPPSMGDADVAGHGGKLLDDMAPEMAKILYVIRARAIQQFHNESEEVILGDRVKKVRIKPVFEEQPPLNIDEKDGEYRVRDEKVIRKHMFKGKTGVLIMEAQQPKSLRIPGARTENPPPITTMAKVQLRFDPHEETAQPPKLGSLSSKLKVTTYYATTTRSNLPSRSTLAYDLTQGYYAMRVPLSSRCIASAGWTRHESEALSRRDSGASIPSIDGGTPASPTNTSPHSIPAASSSYAGGAFYTASVLVPIDLPATKNFLPTFHCCLISRVYSLCLSLSLSGAMAKTLSLKVPLQISAEASAGTRESIVNELEMQMAASDADAMFLPRSVAPPGEEFLGRNESIVSALARDADDEALDLPPSYQYFAPGLRRRRGDVRVAV